jgi:hypothetical protein
VLDATKSAERLKPCPSYGSDRSLHGGRPRRHSPPQHKSPRLGFNRRRKGSKQALRCSCCPIGFVSPPEIPLASIGAVSEVCNYRSLILLGHHIPTGLTNKTKDLIPLKSKCRLGCNLCSSCFTMELAARQRLSTPRCRQVQANTIRQSKLASCYTSDNQFW